MPHVLHPDSTTGQRHRRLARLGRARAEAQGSRRHDVVGKAADFAGIRDCPTVHEDVDRSAALRRRIVAEKHMMPLVRSQRGSGHTPATDPALTVGEYQTDLTFFQKQLPAVRLAVRLQTGKQRAARRPRDADEQAETFRAFPSHGHRRREDLVAPVNLGGFAKRTGHRGTAIDRTDLGPDLAHVTLRRQRREGLGGSEPRFKICVRALRAVFQRGLHRRDLALQRRPPRPVRDRRHEHTRRRVGNIPVHRRHGVVAEKRGQRVKILGANRVEFVVVARRAAGRESEPHRGHRLDAILGVDRFILGRNRSALARGGQATVETGGDFLVDGRFGQQVAGHLLDRKPVERHVLFERVDHPIAVGPDRAVVVDVDAVGVGVAHGV